MHPSPPAWAQQKVPCYSTGRLPIIQPLRSYTLTTRWGEAMLVTRVEGGACAPRLVLERRIRMPQGGDLYLLPAPTSQQGLREWG